MTLVVDGLVVRRGGRAVIDRLGFTVGAGERLAIVGGNGAGKSTLLAALAGVLAPRAGRIEIDGVEVWGARGADARRQLGYAPESGDAPGHLTCAELLALVGACRGVAPALAPAAHAALALDDLVGRRLDQLSLGQRRRACVAAALLGSPPLLLLDEPDNGLAPSTLRALADLLRAYPGAVVLASHDEAFTAAVDARTLRLGA